MYISIGVVIKIAVLVSWRTTPMYLCSSNDLQLEIQKRCSYFKYVALNLLLLVLKLYPIQVVISLPLWIKLTMGQLLLLFLCNFCSFFNYVGGVLVTNLFSLLFIDIFGNSANYNTRGEFVTIFLICSDLLNWLRGNGTIVITKESG